MLQDLILSIYSPSSNFLWINPNYFFVLNPTFNYIFNVAVTHVGKKNGNPQPDIILGGIAIKPNHAEIHNDDGVLTLIPCDVRVIFNVQYIYIE